MLDNNKSPEAPPKKPDAEEDKKFKQTKMIEILLQDGATVADIILNLSHSAIAAGLVNEILAGSSSSSSNEAICVHASPPITVNSSSFESPAEIPEPTEDEEEEENQHFKFERLKSK